jgi:hypothetical protein
MHETPIDPELPILDELGQALHQRALAAERRAGAHGRSRVQRSGPRLSRVRLAIARGARRPLLALAPLAVFGGGVALAATGVLRSGSPVPATAHLTPGAQLGVPLPRRTRLIARSAPDPAGGPPWSMRIVRTTRDVVCLQIARLYGGQLGVIGEDGAFRDDGRFHPLPPGAISRTPRRFLSECYPAGQATAQELSGMPASGELTAAGALDRPAADRRLYFGMLGPAAVSVTYRSHGHTVTLPVEAGSGAYLIVLPGATPAPGVTAGGGTTGAGPFVPSGALTQITYRLGRGLCVERAMGGPRGPDPCPHRGASAPPAKPRDLRRPIQVTLRAVRGELPIPVHLKDGRPLPPGRPRVGLEYEATVTFVAPLAVRNALSGYSLYIPIECRGGGAEETALERNVHAGEVVRIRSHAFPSPCGKGVTIDLYYRGRGGSLLPRGTGAETLVGAATVAKPDGR